MKKRFYTTLAGKVLLAMIAGIITLYAIHSAISTAFDEITENIDRVSSPNEKLLVLNRLFRDITKLNISQQEEAASGRRRPSVSFLNESKAIYETIDTLRLLFSVDTLQAERIEEIYRRLEEREKLFTGFLELQNRTGSNTEAGLMLDKLTKSVMGDTNNETAQVVRLYETTTSTTISADTLYQEGTGFFQRIFGRRQLPEVNGVVRTETTVSTEVKVVIDTLVLSRNDSLYAILENSLDSLRTDQLQYLALLQRQELEMLNATSSLIHEITSIINSVEQEEITILANETISAFEITRATIKKLNYFTIFFIITSILLVILIITDISKSNNYRRKLEVANNEARSEAEAKQRFLSNMSHEIRTPLQSILGYSELAKLQKKRYQYTDRIHQSAEHLLKVVNEVLDYSKVSSGKITTENQPFDPFQEINRVAEAMHPLAMKKKLKLLTQFDPAHPGMLQGDPLKLRQILFNLIGNAIKFTPEGEVKVIAVLEARQDKKVLKIQIIDQGVGISEQKLPYLFEEYYGSGLELSGPNEGTGLGLSIVKKLIEALNGTIEVKSVMNEGSCFSVTIPYSVFDDTTDNSPEKPVIEKLHDAGPRMVMLADDDPHIRNISKAMLRRFNIPFHAFSDGQALLDAFDRNPAEFIFLDIRMPGLGGVETCRRLREHPGNGQNVQIYALTAHVIPEEQESILASGFDGLIIKPFREQDIMEVLSGKSGKISVDSVPYKMDNLLRMAGDDPTEVAGILKSIIIESRKDLGAIKSYTDKKEFSNLLLVVHRMAGRAGQAGAGKYAARLREVERMIKNQNGGSQIEGDINEILREGDFFIRDIKTCMDTFAKRKGTAT